MFTDASRMYGVSVHSPDVPPATFAWIRRTASDVVSDILPFDIRSFSIRHVVTYAPLNPGAPGTCLVSSYAV
jgi:hypothetical protein